MTLKQLTRKAALGTAGIAATVPGVLVLTAGPAHAEGLRPAHTVWRGEVNTGSCYIYANFFIDNGASTYSTATGDYTVNTCPSPRVRVRAKFKVDGSGATDIIDQYSYAARGSAVAVEACFWLDPDSTGPAGLTPGGHIWWDNGWHSDRLPYPTCPF